MSFQKVFDSYNWEITKESIYQKSTKDVQHALAKEHLDLEDFKALISPAGLPFLEQMAQKSHQLTIKRFGKGIQMYAPMYLSNVCENICTYCGFSMNNRIKRRILTDAEIIEEAKFIRNLGYQHILLVTGEANRKVGVSYLKNAIELVKPYFPYISIEVQPLEQNEYESLISAGLHAVLVYQESYHRETYQNYHTRGKKSNFDYRLDTPDRLGNAQIHKIGVGALLGLEDWRTESFFTALHLDYLEKKYWQTIYSISFPRIRPHEGEFEPNIYLSDKELVQLICAYRLFNPEVELSISTRESEMFRDHIIKLGITSMSAESKTNPGGYSVDPESLEQFEISDERPTQEIVQMLKKNGYEAVWKGWDMALQ
ncbi:MAG: 2-iminoacetate synthase ThiH [Flavobacteriales bacterium]|nr:2-iminoacetate synthase ThiH [Flavobacteriales bacterium]